MSISTNLSLFQTINISKIFLKETDFERFVEVLTKFSYQRN